MEHGTRGIHISAGEGIVAHVGQLTAYASGDEQRLNELLVRLNASATEPWTEVVRSLTSGISDVGFDVHPALACVNVEDGKVSALVFGAAALTITIDGSQTVLDGRDSSTWIDVALRGNVETVHAGTQSSSTVVGVLRDGVVPAGGFLLDTIGPIPAANRWDEVVDGQAVTVPIAADPAATPAAEPAQEEPETQNDASGEPAVAAQQMPEQTTSSTDFPSAPSEPDEASTGQRSMFARIEEIGRVSRTALAPESDGAQTAAAVNEAEPQAQNFSESPFANSPAEAEAETDANASTSHWPQLRGVHCPTGHLTAPSESTCRSCGIHVPHDTAAAIGPRPELGTITFDDGAVLRIDRPAVIGADVPPGYVVEDEPATIVRLDDGVGGVSSIHMEVRLSGWNVEIVDMASDTGTYTMLEGERSTRTKLRDGQATVLQRNMEVQAGGRSFVFTVDQTANVEA